MSKTSIYCVAEISTKVSMLMSYPWPVLCCNTTCASRGDGYYIVLVLLIRPPTVVSAGRCVRAASLLCYTSTSSSSRVRFLAEALVNHLSTVFPVVKLSSIGLRSCVWAQSSHFHWEAAEQGSVAHLPVLVLAQSINISSTANSVN